MAITISPQQSQAGIEAKPYYLPEVAGATWKAGAPLVRDANGFMAECGAAPALIWGFAAHDGQNLASSGLKKCAVYRAAPMVRFEGTLLEALAVTQQGESYGLVKGGDGVWYISSADAGDQVTALSYSSRSTVGSANQTVDFEVETANIQEP